jgi:hypothetical protein
MPNVIRTRPAACGFALVSLFAVAQQPVVKPPAAEPPSENKALSDQFRGLLLKHLPDPLVEHTDGWGEQREVTIGLKWERKGAIRFRPELMRDVKNDGHWQKVTVAAVDPAKSLTVAVTGVRVKDGKTLFDAAVGLDVKPVYAQQMWAMGKRVYAGETRCRTHADLKVTVELTSQAAFKPGAVLPELSLRVRVVSADLTYRDLVCEHTLGVGGEAAKVLGKAAHEFVKKAKPDLEKGLLTKANAAIVKAADTKEVKVELDKLLGGAAAKTK